MNVIVFSKDRPLQLDAYLESLLFFSNLTSSQITIIYRESQAIPYNKVIQRFNDCVWIKESNFDLDLRNAVSVSDNYIMFGCDDVVFTGQLNLNECIEYLSAHNEVFGLSLRLGVNILPHPKFINNSSGFRVWDWAKTNVPHYNYPWELDATIYRKSDVQNIIVKISNIKSPNFLESLVADRAEALIPKKLLASQNSRSKAIVITVNRVQETHPNVVDETIDYSIERLYDLYEKHDCKINFRAISNMPSSRIHVGAEYMVFEKNSFMLFRFFIIKLKRKLLSVLGLGFNNK